MSDLGFGLIIETLTHLALALTRTAWFALTVFVIFGAHASIWPTTSTSVRQRAVSAEFQGRVASVYLTSVVGGMVIGSALGGLVASAWGITAPFWFAFAGSAIILALIWRSLLQIAHTDENLAPTLPPPARDHSPQPNQANVNGRRTDHTDGLTAGTNSSSSSRSNACVRVHDAAAPALDHSDPFEVDPRPVVRGLVHHPLDHRRIARSEGIGPGQGDVHRPDVKGLHPGEHAFPERLDGGLAFVAAVCWRCRGRSRPAPAHR